MSVEHSVSSGLRAILYSGEFIKIQRRSLCDKQIAFWSFDGTLRICFQNCRWKFVVVKNEGRLFQKYVIEIPRGVCV